MADDALINLAQFSTKQRKDLAKKGQAIKGADSGGAYPIRNERDLKNAIQAFGRAKNPEQVKAHIKKRAHALGLTHLLPDSWKGSTVSTSASDDSSLVKLAKITRVEAHKRRGKGGKTEDVDSYLRKVLDKFGIGADEKTKKGAFQGSPEAQARAARDARTAEKNRKSPNRVGDDEDAAEAIAMIQRGPRGQELFEDHDIDVAEDPRKVSPERLKEIRAAIDAARGPEGRAVYKDNLPELDAYEKKVEEAERLLKEKRVTASVPADEARELRLSGVTQDDLDTIIMLGSRASLDRSPKKNWVENSGELPGYVREIARSIEKKRGVPLSRAIALAIGAIKRWARGGGDVDADTRSKAAAALAQWEALKGKNKARQATK